MYQVNNWLLLSYAGFRVAGDTPVSFRARARTSVGRRNR